jgi:hypothetical protein
MLWESFTRTTLCTWRVIVGDNWLGHFYTLSIKVRVSFYYYYKYTVTINLGMCRAYCNKIIKLSDALQPFAVEKEVVCNVHGKRDFICYPFSAVLTK